MVLTSHSTPSLSFSTVSCLCTAGENPGVVWTGAAARYVACMFRLHLCKVLGLRWGLWRSVKSVVRCSMVHHGVAAAFVARLGLQREACGEGPHRSLWSSRPTLEDICSTILTPPAFPRLREPGTEGTGRYLGDGQAKAAPWPPPWWRRIFFFLQVLSGAPRRLSHHHPPLPLTHCPAAPGPAA